VLDRGPSRGRPGAAGKTGIHRDHGRDRRRSSDWERQARSPASRRGGTTPRLRSRT
jgi:hypothetical protein